MRRFVSADFMRRTAKAQMMVCAASSCAALRSALILDAGLSASILFILTGLCSLLCLLGLVRIILAILAGAGSGAVHNAEQRLAFSAV